jgi:hypothetical protein
MNDGFTAVTVTMFLLDYSSPIPGLALLDYRTISVTIGGLAHGYTGTHRARMHTDFVGNRRR